MRLCLDGALLLLWDVSELRDSQDGGCAEDDTVKCVSLLALASWALLADIAPTSYGELLPRGGCQSVTSRLRLIT